MEMKHSQMVEMLSLMAAKQEDSDHFLEALATQVVDEKDFELGLFICSLSHAMKVIMHNQAWKMELDA